MKILEASQVDLIEPFPLTQVHRAVGWLHCFKSLITSDDGPQDSESMKSFLESMFTSPNFRSWGIIDRDQKLNIRHEAPLIGFIAFERANLRNGYFHVATTRKAWGSGMVDDAAKLVLKTVFEESPELLRVSSFVINNNYPAKALARRMGFSTEGVFQDFVLQGGEPRPITHFGLTRRNWNNTCPSSLLSPSSLPESEPQPAL